MAEATPSALRAWLDQRWMGKYEEKFSSSDKFSCLAAVRASTAEEKRDIIQWFEKPGLRLKMRLLLEELPSEDASQASSAPSAASAASDAQTGSDEPGQAKPALPSQPPPSAQPVKSKPPPPSQPPPAAAVEAVQAQQDSAPAGNSPPPIPPVPAEVAVPQATSSSSGQTDSDADAMAHEVPDLPSFLDRDDFSSDSEDDGNFLDPSQIPTEIPALPDSASEDSSDEDYDDDEPGAGGLTAPRQKQRQKSRLIQQKIAALVAKGNEQAAANTTPSKGKIAVSQSSEFKSKAAALKGLKFGVAPPPNIRAKLQPAASTASGSSAASGASVVPTARFLDALKNITKQGELEKRGVGMLNKSWKSRYFVLHGDCLYWLKKQDDAKAAGTLLLTEPGLLLRRTDDVRELEVTNRKKTWRFRALTAEDAAEWFDAMRAIQSAAESKQTPAGTGSASAVHADETGVEDSAEREKLMDILKIGAVFIKYRHKRGKERLIWCPVSLDRLLWGKGNKQKVKGYMMAADIQRLSDGCFGAKNSANAFTVIGSERTLELEAPSAQAKDEWMKAIRLLVKR